MDEILLQKNQKVSTTKEIPGKIESDLDENKPYQIDNTSIDDNKEKLE